MAGWNSQQDEESNRQPTTLAPPGNGVPFDSPTPVNVVVLAGDRGPDDPLCQSAGVPAKALVTVGGRRVLDRVLDVLASLPGTGTRLVSGPNAAALTTAPDLQQRLDAAGWTWVAPANSPAASALAAVRQVQQANLETDAHPLLLTTGDHALLQAATLAQFLARARARAGAHAEAASGPDAAGADLAVGFVSHARVRDRFPANRRTALRFRDGEVCTCNLFLLLTPRAAAVLDLWRRVEQDRKKPWKVVRLLGPVTLVRFLLGRVTLAEALMRLGRIAGVRIVPILLDDPEAAVDVDSVADRALVEAVLAERAAAARAVP